MEFGVRGTGQDIPNTGGSVPSQSGSSVATRSLPESSLPPVRVECKVCCRFMRGERTSTRISDGICPRCLEAVYPADLVATIRASCGHEQIETVDVRRMTEAPDLEIRTVRCEICGHKWDLEPAHVAEDGGR